MAKFVEYQSESNLSLTQHSKIACRKLVMVHRFVADNKFRTWLKRLGLVGFMFFFIKGLAWLAVIYFGVKLF